MLMRTILKLITKHLYGKGFGNFFGLNKLYRKLAKQNSVDKVTLHGVTFYLDEGDNLLLSVGMKPEPETTQYFKNNVKEGDVFVDVGAHIGYYTVLASQLVGEKGRVIAFEPDEENFKVLKKNTENLGNVVLYNCAVSDFTGKASFFLADRSGNHSLIQNKDRIKQTRVKVLKLDDYVKKADWVKIDVQGAELEVLKGMQRLLKNKKMVLVVELEVEEGKEKPLHYEYLLSLGYSVKRVDFKNSKEMYSYNLVCSKGELI